MAKKKSETPCENCSALAEHVSRLVDHVMEQENRIRELRWMLQNYKALERLGD